MALEDSSMHRGQLWTLSNPNGEAQRLTQDVYRNRHGIVVPAQYRSDARTG